jgi:hypothetical protein
MAGTNTFVVCIAAISLHIGPATSFAAELTDKLAACRSVEPVSERAACYDNVVDQLAEGTATPEPDRPSQEELFGKNADDVRSAVGQASGEQRIEKLEATVSTLHEIAPGRVVMTLENGQTWQQSGSSRLRLSQGDTIIIEEASMGSFMLHKLGSARSMRVRRID